MKKAIAAVLVLGLIGAGGCGAYYWLNKDADTQPDRVSSDSEDAVYVDSVATITGHGSGNGLQERYGGEIKPQDTLEIELDANKKVEECFVKAGDKIKAGQRLFTYSTQEDEDSLAQAEIDLERLEGDIEVANKQIEQLEKAKKTATADDQLTLTTEIMSLQTSIKKYEYEMKTKNLEIEKLKDSIASAAVYAEMGGIVQKVADSSNTDSYSYGNEDSAYITILAEGDFRVKGSANEQAINQMLVYEGMPVIVYSRVDSSITWDGIVSEVNTDNAEEQDNSMYYSMGSSGASSSYAFYVELESSEGLILGQHVYMEENVGQNDQRDGLWLEEYYIVDQDEKQYVWMADTSNLLKLQEITVGEYDEELMKYEILDGLTAEDYIAFPMDTLTESAPVIYNDYASAADPIGDDWSGDDEMGAEDDLYMEDGMENAVFDADADYYVDEVYVAE